MNIYEKRLFEEWRTHGKIILALDFDSTISYWNTIENQEDMNKVIKIVKEAQQVGCYTVIFSACNEDRVDYIRSYCTKIGLSIDSINENPIVLPYGTGRKIYYNLLIDDRSGLNEALSILQNVMTQIRSEKNFESLSKLNCIDP